MIQIVLICAIITVYCYLLFWIWKLENTGCVCSRDWRRDFIMYWMIVYSFAIWLPMIVKNNYFIAIFTILLAIFYIASIIIVFQYVRMLKYIKCECSDGTERKVMEIFNYIQIGLFILGIIGIIGFYMMIASAAAAAAAAAPPVRRQIPNAVIKPQVK